MVSSASRRAFARICDMRGLAYRLLSRGELDIADPASVDRALARHAPWAVVNAAGYVRVDQAELEALWEDEKALE